jgi:hypothetical protein
MNMASSSNSSSNSSSSSSSSSTAAITQALTAARQLSSLWKPRQAAKLLTQPPPAAFTGRAKEAAQESSRLLVLLFEALAAVHGATASEQVLHGLFQQYEVVKLLATLTAWVQQSQSFAHAQSGRGLPLDAAAADVWVSSMDCFTQLLAMLIRCQPANKAVYAGQLAQALDSAGAL